MSLNLSSLAFVWLLASCGAVITQQNDRAATPSGRVTAQEAPTSGPPDHAARVQQSAQTPAPAVQTGAAATFSPLPELSSSTRAGNATTGQQADVSTQPGAPTTAVATPMATSSTPTTRPSSTSTPTTRPSSTSTPTTRPSSTSTPTTRPPGTTAFTSTPPTITTDVRPTATRTPGDIIRPEEEGGRLKEGATKEANPGTVVAGVIGGTLVLMMASFLLIYIKKQRLNEQQVTSKNWAGPSPFIENGEDGGGVGRRSSNRISLSSFLPHSVSRRLSLLPEAEEEMEEINQGTTFGDRREGAPSDQQGAGRDVQESTGAAAHAPGAKTTNGVAETKENGVLTAVSLTDELPANGVGEAAQG